MPKTKIFRHIEHTPENLLEMVADVAGYPEFIPLITQTRILKSRAVTAHHRCFEADAIISYKMLNEAFRSEVNIHTDRKIIEVKKPNTAGAVKTLSNRWEFHGLSDGSTLVEFDVDVGLQNFVLNRLVADRFDKASHYVMKLFVDRANDLFETVGRGDLDLQSEYENLGLSRYFI